VIASIHSKVNLVFMPCKRRLSGTFLSCPWGIDGRCRLVMLLACSTVESYSIHVGGGSTECAV